MHELCTHPPALFESRNTMRPANKAQLADALWSQEINADRSNGAQYVLDGGALLHRIPWTKGSRWEDIYASYTPYVSRMY